MAGLGYKLFASGEVLTAANLQGYAVDQSTMVFATAAARNSAITSPSQGMTAFTNDSGITWQYFELYNASTNTGGASAAGWYPIAGSAMFYGTASRSTTTATSYTVGDTGFLFTENIDPLGWHSAATNTDRITPTIAGVYRLSVASQPAANASGNRVIGLQKNGSNIGGVGSSAASGFIAELSPSVINTANGSTDYFRVSYQQTSGSTLVVPVQVSMEFLRPLQT
jgi:hypothetical protein